MRIFFFNDREVIVLNELIVLEVMLRVLEKVLVCLCLNCDRECICMILDFRSSGMVIR